MPMFPQLVNNTIQSQAQASQDPLVFFPCYQIEDDGEEGASYTKS